MTKTRQEGKHRGTNHVWITNFIVNHRRCLVLYAPDEWGKYAAGLTRASPKDRDVAFSKPSSSAAGPMFHIDREGGVRLPPCLREFINHDPRMPPGQPRTVVLSRPDPRWML